MDRATRRRGYVARVRSRRGVDPAPAHCPCRPSRMRRAPRRASVSASLARAPKSVHQLAAVRWAFLAPDIQRAILEGREPEAGAPSRPRQRQFRSCGQSSELCWRRASPLINLLSIEHANAMKSTVALAYTTAQARVSQAANWSPTSSKPLPPRALTELGAVSLTATLLHFKLALTRL